MILTPEEEQLLAQGGAVAQALAEQISVGEFFGADRFVSITNAHFTGDPEVFGDAGREYLEQLIAGGATCRVPTTRNATCVDIEALDELAQSTELAQDDIVVRKLLTRLGSLAVNTCIGYQTVYQPQRGEHVAWGDTGTVAYANSVLGARTNYEAGPASLLAGITGRTPAYGFHLDEHRAARYLVTVDFVPTDYAHWGAIGAVVGTRYRGYDNVVAIEVPERATADTDDLKHLAAAVSSYGSMAMFHVIGATPEAPDLLTATQGKPLLDHSVLTREDLAEVMYTENDNAPDVTVFTAPQLSLFEISRIDTLMRGRRVRPGTTLIVTTNRMVGEEADRLGHTARLREAGVKVIHDTCWYLMDPAAQRKAFGWTTLSTNSAKLANIVRAHGYQPTIRTTAECIAVSTEEI